VSDLTDRGPIHPTMVEAAFVWFQRLIAGSCLVFGVLYWVRLVGFYDGSLWRFDLMPIHWQVAAVILSVFYPFAAIGLWMLASWGPVIWGICALTETVMYFVYPDLSGHRMLVVGAHLCVALLYAAFRLLIHWQRRGVERYG
jgi:hypothetical protein